MAESMSCQITCQITSVELAQIDQLLARTGQTRSEWVQGLVQAALSETPINVRNLAERVDSLEQTTTQLMALQHQVEQLTQQMTDSFSRKPSTDGSQDSSSSPDQANPSSTSSLSASPSPSATSQTTASPSDSPSPSMSLSSPTPSIYDVEEDEPDEILYEFLEPEASSPSSVPSSSTSNSIYDGEDEPYEILYDFLEPEDR